MLKLIVKCYFHLPGGCYRAKQANPYPEALTRESTSPAMSALPFLSLKTEGRDQRGPGC